MTEVLVGVGFTKITLDKGGYLELRGHLVSAAGLLWNTVSQCGGQDPPGLLKINPTWITGQVRMKKHIGRD